VEEPVGAEVVPDVEFGSRSPSRSHAADGERPAVDHLGLEVALLFLEVVRVVGRRLAAEEEAEAGAVRRPPCELIISWTPCAFGS